MSNFVSLFGRNSFKKSFKLKTVVYISSFYLVNESINARLADHSKKMFTEKSEACSVWEQLFYYFILITFNF